MNSQPHWHSLSSEQAFAHLRSAPAGLTSADAALRLAEHGPNELQAARRISPWAILLEQFKNVLIIILLIATALSAVLGHGTEAIVITVIVLFAVGLGFAQEYRAERAIEALRKMAAPTATVLRDVIVATGMQTEFGQVAQLLQTVESGRTPLQENLDKVGHVLARAAFVIVAIIVALGVVRGQPILDMPIFGIALAVAVVPEALSAVVTISLAIGVQRMVKRHALVRRLPAVETLGSTSVICSDKTGTLTRDEMTIRKLRVAGCDLELAGAGYDPHGAFSEYGSTPLRRKSGRRRGRWRARRCACWPWRPNPMPRFKTPNAR